MSDGNETDARGLAAEIAAATRADLQDISDAVADASNSIADLDRKLQVAQAASAENDQRWELRINTLESRLLDIDHALRSEVERVRGSAGVLELLTQEFRSVMGDTRDLASATLALDSRVQGLAEEMHSTRELDVILAAIDGFGGRLEHVEELIGRSTDRPDQVSKSDLAGLDDRLETIRDHLDALRVKPPDTAALAEPLAAVQTDLVALRDDQQQQLIGLLGELGSLREMVEALGQKSAEVPDSETHDEVMDAIGSLTDDVATLRSGFDPIREGFDQALATLRDELQEMRVRQPDPEVVDARLDALRSELSERFGAVVEQLDSLRMRQLDPAIFDQTLQSLRSDVDELTTSDRGVADRIDSIRDELTSTGGLAHQMANLLDRFQQSVEASSARDTGQDEATLVALEAIRSSVEQLSAEGPSSDRLEQAIVQAAAELDRSAAERSTRDLTAMAEVVASIPDPTAGLRDLRESVEELLQERHDLTEALSNLSERTEGAVGALRGGIEDRLAAIDTSRSADATELREGLAELLAREISLSEQIATTTEQTSSLRAQLGGETSAIASQVSALVPLLEELGRARSEEEMGVDAALQPVIGRLEIQAAHSESVAARLDELSSGLELLLARDQEAVSAATTEQVDAIRDRLDQGAAEQRAAADRLHESIEGLRGSLPTPAAVSTDVEHRLAPVISEINTSVSEVVTRIEQEIARRLETTDAGVARLEPALDAVRSSADRVGTTLEGHAETLAQMDRRTDDMSASLEPIVAGIARLEALDVMRDDVAALNERLGDLDQPLLAARLTDLESRIEALSGDLSSSIGDMSGKLDVVRSDGQRHHELLDVRLAEDRSGADEKLASIADSTARAARELTGLRGDVEGQRNELEEQLTQLGDSVTETLHAAREAAVMSGRSSVDDVLSALAEMRSGTSTHSQELNETLSSVRQLIGDRLSEIEHAIDQIDLTSVSSALDESTQAQVLANEQTLEAIERDREVSQAARETIEQLAARLGTTTLAAIDERLGLIEDQQRANEQQLVESLASMRESLATFDVEPLLSRAEALESLVEESDSGLRAAIAETRAAVFAMDLGSVESRIASLDTEHRDLLAQVTAQLTDLSTALEGGSIGAAVEAATGSKHDELRGALQQLADSVDAQAGDGRSIQAQLSALDASLNDSSRLEEEIRDAVTEVRQRVGTLDLNPLLERLDQLAEAMHVTDEASRASLAEEIRAVADQMRESAAESPTQALLEQFEALRGAVLDRFSGVSEEHRRALTERIDALGNVVVERLDDTRAQTDGLAVQVGALHGSLTGRSADGELQGHLDRALEGLAERLGSALRELRIDLLDQRADTDLAGVRTALEADLQRLGQKVDSEAARIIDALTGRDDTDRLRRIDSSITDIRRDFEVLRRLTDRVVATTD